VIERLDLCRVQSSLIVHVDFRTPSHPKTPNCALTRGDLICVTSFVPSLLRSASLAALSVAATDGVFAQASSSRWRRRPSSRPPHLRRRAAGPDQADRADDKQIEGVLTQPRT